MDETGREPQTLIEAIQYFADEDVALQTMVRFRWPDGVHCPRCHCHDVYFLPSRRIWQCKGCRKQFSAKVGTIFEDSPIKLGKWFAAMWMVVNCKNGISSYEVHRALGVTQKTAWFMLHRIRLAMQAQTFEKLSGEVEADETYIGGLARNMHKSKRAEKITGTGGAGKSAVMGLLERHGEVRTKHVPNNRRSTLQREVRQNVEPGSEVFTDALKSYEGLEDEYVHQVIDHAEAYARGKVHTNGLENFWSLLKRGIKGTYVSVEPFHLFRYLDEEAFRYNGRKGSDADRFGTVGKRLAGRRLTYEKLTGGEQATSGRGKRNATA